jgi:multidrug efflux pump
MGIAVIGGLTFGTVLTLYVVPVMYSYLTSREWKRSIAAEDARSPAPIGDPEPREA